MSNKYLLTAATLAGVAAGSVGTATLTAWADVPTQKYAETSRIYTHAQIRSATGQSLVDAGCGNFDSNLKLSGRHACAMSDLLGWNVRLNTPEANQATVDFYANFDGTWGRE